MFGGKDKDLASLAGYYREPNRERFAGRQVFLSLFYHSLSIPVTCR